jgi:hypothetical protein
VSPNKQEYDHAEADTRNRCRIPDGLGGGSCADHEPGAVCSREGNGTALTDEQAKGWIDKVVYDSDGKKFGEVAAFARDGSGKVTEMHADTGGFLGLGQTRVRVMPSQFKLIDDRAVLLITAEQAKTLPKVES